MKVDELRVLEADELSVRMRQARRELYELRFKHAVGQLENSSQISKVRHDIARIMTVLRERDFGIVASLVADALEPAAAAAPQPEPAAAATATATEEAPEAPAAKPKRTRKKAEETK
jgi:large subunit ribosomal protein L29